MNKKLFKLITSSIITSQLLFGFSAGALTLKQADSQAKNLYQSSKENYAKGVDAYKNAKKNLTDLQSKIKNATEEQKNKFKEQLQEKSGEFLTNEISAMIKYLEAMKNKASGVRGVSASDRVQIIAELDAQIKWLQDESAKISSATQEQLKTIHQEIKDRWTNIRVTSRRVLGELFVARIKYAINKGEAMAVEFEKKINELGQQGSDVTKLNELLKNYRDKISLAEDKYTAAKAKFQAISSKDNAVSLFQEGQKLIKDANQYVKQANQDLKQIVTKLKQFVNLDKPNATTTP